MSVKNQGVQHKMQATASGDFGPVNAVPTMRCPMCSGAGSVFGHLGGRGPAAARTHCPQVHGSEVCGNQHPWMPAGWERDCLVCEEMSNKARRKGLRRGQQLTVTITDEAGEFYNTRCGS